MIDFPSFEILCKQKALAKNISLFKKGFKPQKSGNSKFLVKGQGLEFRQVRRYNFGDEIKNIDWRVTARTGKTHIKEFDEEKISSVTIIADLSENMLFSTQGNFKYFTMLESISLLLCAAKNEKADCLSIFFGSLIREHKTFAKNVNEAIILNYLTGKKERQKNSISLKECLSHTIFNIHKGGLIFLFVSSNEINQDLSENLSYLQRRGQVFIIYIYDKAEYELPEMNDACFVGEEGGQKRVSVSNSDAKEYNEAFLVREKEMLRICNKSGIIYLSFLNTESILSFFS